MIRRRFISVVYGLLAGGSISLSLNLCCGERLIDPTYKPVPKEAFRAIVPMELDVVGAVICEFTNRVYPIVSVKPPDKRLRLRSSAIGGAVGLSTGALLAHYLFPKSPAFKIVVPLLLGGIGALLGKEYISKYQSWLLSKTRKSLVPDKLVQQLNIREKARRSCYCLSSSVPLGKVYEQPVQAGTTIATCVVPHLIIEPDGTGSSDKINTEALWVWSLGDANHKVRFEQWMKSIEADPSYLRLWVKTLTGSTREVPVKVREDGMVYPQDIIESWYRMNYHDWWYQHEVAFLQRGVIIASNRIGTKRLEPIPRAKFDGEGHKLNFLHRLEASPLQKLMLFNTIVREERDTTLYDPKIAHILKGFMVG